MQCTAASHRRRFVASCEGRHSLEARRAEHWNAEAIPHSMLGRLAHDPCRHPVLWRVLDIRPAKWKGRFETMPADRVVPIEALPIVVRQPCSRPSAQQHCRAELQFRLRKSRNREVIVAAFSRKNRYLGCYPPGIDVLGFKIIDKTEGTFHKMRVAIRHCARCSPTLAMKAGCSAIPSL